MFHFKEVFSSLFISFFIIASFQCPLLSESISNKTNYPSLCQLAADHDEVFATFKQNPDYQSVLEHVSYETGVLYLNIILKDYPELLEHLEDFRKNDQLGSPLTYYYEGIGYFSPTTLRYMKVAGDLQKQFGDLSQMHIVEIGGGYGGLCKIIADLCGFASYTLIDLPECNQLSKKYLSLLGVQNVRFVNHDHLHEVEKCDLVISNYAFSELDRKEQLEYIQKIIHHAPNGYMTLNFISHHFHLKSFSMEELIRNFYNNKINGKRTAHIKTEEPLTHPDNLLLTWYTDKISTKTLQKQPDLIPSTSFQTSNAITYNFSGGRLGDDMIAYFHAKWLAYKYGLPFIYKSFPYSDHFGLHDRDHPAGKEFSFQNVHQISKESDIQTTPSSTLFVVPYFPETRSEYEWVNLYHLPFFHVDWEDRHFHNEVVKCLNPKYPIKTLKLPSRAITTVAVHIRRGIEYDSLHKLLPLKFVYDAYYIEQLQRIAKIFPHRLLYVYIFTDDPSPQHIVEKYKNILKNNRIVFDCQKSNDLLEDFFSIPKFDCCILCQSNFSVVASKLGNYSILISPVHTVMKNGTPVIDQVDLIFKGW